MGFYKKYIEVDTLMLPVKMHYFLFMAALACVLPFRTVFARQLGISATAVGVIFLATPFFKTVTNPLFGFVIDYFKKFRLTLSLLMVAVAVTHVSMLYVPPMYSINELKENNPQVLLKYDCSDKDNSFNDSKGPYLHVYIKIKAPGPDNLVDISCELTCSSDATSSEMYVEEGELCQGPITVESQLTLKGRSCHFEPLLVVTESLVRIQNSTRILSQVSDETINSRDRFKEIQLFNEKNCSHNMYKDSNYNITECKQNSSFNTGRTFENFGVMLDSNQLLNSTLETWFGDEHKQNHTWKAHKVCLLTDSDCHLSCPCKVWLHCVTKNCTHSNAPQEVSRPHENEYISAQFWALFMLIAISSATFAAVCFLVDAVCYEMLSNKDFYGEQRLWGTIGWGLGAFAGGYLNQIISAENASIDYTLSFYLLALLIVIDLIPVSRIRVDEVKYSHNICKDVFFLLSEGHILINITMVFAIGVLSGLMWNYQFWFMEEIGATQVLLGLSQIVECLLSELPCFMISGWVIRKIGYVNCNSLTFLCFGVRYLCFSYMQDPWMTLPVGLMYGPTFGIFYASVTMYGKTEAPPGTEATVQSVLAVAFEGVGCGTGSILGGIGFDTLGSRATFLFSGIASFVLLAINVLLHIFVLRRKNKPSIKSGLPAVDCSSHL